jgi:hypothetical protein
MSCSSARYYGKLRGSRGSDPRLLRLTMNRLLDCTSQERPSTSSFVCVAKFRPSYVTITQPGSIDPCQVRRRTLDLSSDAINSPKILCSSPRHHDAGAQIHPISQRQPCLAPGNYAAVRFPDDSIRRERLMDGAADDRYRNRALEAQTYIPLNLRRIYLRSNGGPREDEIIKVRWCGRAATTEAIDALLQADLKSSHAHGVQRRFHSRVDGVRSGPPTLRN